MGWTPDEVLRLLPSLDDFRKLEVLPPEFESALIELVTNVEGVRDEVAVDERLFVCGGVGCEGADIEPIPEEFLESLEEFPPWLELCCCASEVFPSELRKDGASGGLLTGPIGVPPFAESLPEVTTPLLELSEA